MSKETQEWLRDAEMAKLLTESRDSVASYKNAMRQIGVEFSTALTDAGFVGYEMEETEEELMKQLKEITDE